MSTSQLLKDADSLVQTDPPKSESLYKQILAAKGATTDDGQVQAALLRDQEAALVNLGKLYRDQQCVYLSVEIRVLIVFRNAQALADIITMSRGFMTSTAKAKTAKLSTCHTTLINFLLICPSPNTSRLLLLNTGQPENPNVCSHRQH